jgi:hypothetical protein
MKKQLLIILKIYSHEYELKVLDLYTAWCAKRSKNQQQLQKLLICPALFNWWYRELESLEANFVKHAGVFGTSLSKEVAESYYNEIIADIHNVFSKPLIKKANDIHSITEQN